MKASQVFNLNQWVAENKHLLVPPVANQTIYTSNKDFIVMIVGGPNARNDFHVNAGEELFYQLEGHIEVKLIDENGKMHVQSLGPGDMMLVPGNTPHSPKRTAGSIGLVIERYRKEGEKDGFVWYCENCGNKLHEHYEVINDIVTQLPPILNAFQENLSLRTCVKCGTVAPIPVVK
jgi:3-hydroxyanthranilate 3,4-dioxygenase